MFGSLFSLELDGEAKLTTNTHITQAPSRSIAEPVPGKDGGDVEKGGWDLDLDVKD